MISRSIRLIGASCLSALLLVGHSTSASGQMGPDTGAMRTADGAGPDIDLVPRGCDQGRPCQASNIDIFGVIPDGTDLVSLKIRLEGPRGARAVNGTVYPRDAKGRPGGTFHAEDSDEIAMVDYAVSARLAMRTTYRLIATAADSAGALTTLTATVTGPTPPSHVTDVRASVDRRDLTIFWRMPTYDHGALTKSYRIDVDGRHRETVHASYPGTQDFLVRYRLSPGRHRVEIRAVNRAGAGAPAAIRARIPR